jgi:hypothetical protein
VSLPFSHHRLKLTNVFRDRALVMRCTYSEILKYMRVRPAGRNTVTKCQGSRAKSGDALKVAGTL